MIDDSLFVEVDYFYRHKRNENICGDAFVSKKIPSENRVLAVLSDGLGSGVKANILASMTATMAIKFVAANRDIVRASEVIMDSLPVCQVRQISYATFSIIDTVLHGKTQLVEQGNPPAIIVRDQKLLPIERKTITTPRWKKRTLTVAEFTTEPEDRVIVFSDGVSQAGMGGEKWKLGWRSSGCSEYILSNIKNNPDISANQLARNIVNEAVRKDPDCMAGDDISCSVLYFRKPRKLLALSGPPFDSNRDREIASRVERYAGRVAICGGTTANIIGRELRRKITMPLTKRHGDLPPTSEMTGVDLVTEGILTLTQTAQNLENHKTTYSNDAAGKLTQLLLESDQIEFLVGTRINEAHQDPTLPIDLEIRRNIVKRIAAALQDNYLKETQIQYI